MEFLAERYVMLIQGRQLENYRRDSERWGDVAETSAFWGCSPLIMSHFRMQPSFK